MKRTLIDTGPLVALIDAGDADHEGCVAAAKQVRGDLVTTWPVITEAMYLLAHAPAGQDALLGKVESRELIIAAVSADDIPGVRALMRKYRDQPMDFADASLVRIAEREGIAEAFTLDRRDFSIYRLPRARRFRIIP